MITSQQINDLSQQFHIDEVSIMREYLQLLFLNYLYQRSDADSVYFKGGTAIHLLYGSNRFSEDLDFSTTRTRQSIKKLLSEIPIQMERELPGIQLRVLYSGIRSVRYRMTFHTELLKYPLAIRIDLSFDDPVYHPVSSSLSTKFPVIVYPQILHLSAEELLAEKIRALLTRGKGRDMYDLWYLLEQNVIVDNALVKKKLKRVSRQYDRDELLHVVKLFNQSALQRDLAKFLPRSDRVIIPHLKDRLLKQLENK